MPGGPAVSLPTFNPPCPPQAGSKSKPELKLRKAEFGDGYTQTTRDGLNHIRQVFNLTWERLPASDADAILAFFEERGGDQPFYYAVPGTSRKVKWTCEEWERQFYGANIAGVSAVLRQSFNLDT
jgi:phage-related protein